MIEIRNARFFSYHGFYEEEQLVGNEFFVSICCSFHTQPIDSDELSDTLNYEQLYSIVKAQMQVPRKLLETVAYSVLNDVKKCADLLEEARVEIRKINPPFGGDQAEAVVLVSWDKGSSGT